MRFGYFIAQRLGDRPRDSRRPGRFRRARPGSPRRGWIPGRGSIPGSDSDPSIAEGVGKGLVWKRVGHNHQFENRPLQPDYVKNDGLAEHRQSIQGMVPERPIVGRGRQMARESKAVSPVGYSWLEQRFHLLRPDCETGLGLADSRGAVDGSAGRARGRAVGESRPTRITTQA